MSPGKFSPKSIVEPLEIRIEPSGSSTPNTGLLTSESASPTISKLIRPVSSSNGSVDIERTVVVPRLQSPSIHSIDRSEQVSLFSAFASLTSLLIV
jgi:hypothetical protein